MQIKYNAVFCVLCAIVLLQAALFVPPLVLAKDGTVAAWGCNESGQTNVPPDLGLVKEVSAGFGHSLALKHNHTVAAWGMNDAGQGAVPAGLSDVKAIAAGGFHNLVLK